MSSKEKRGGGPSVTQHSGKEPSFNTRKTSTNASGKSWKNADLAKGGDAHMFGSQQAETNKKPGITGKRDSSGPGQKFAEGGRKGMHAFDGALPAVAGRVAQPTMKQSPKAQVPGVRMPDWFRSSDRHPSRKGG